MSEVTTGEIDAARRWAESVESVSPYQRIISLCNALDARDATIAALTEVLRQYVFATEEVFRHVPNTGIGLLRTPLDLARAVLTAPTPAPTPEEKNDE